MTSQLDTLLGFGLSTKVQQWTADNIVRCVSDVNQVTALVTYLHKNERIGFSYSLGNEVFTYQFRKDNYMVTASRVINFNLEEVRMPIFALREGV